MTLVLVRRDHPRVWPKRVHDLLNRAIASQRGKKATEPTVTDMRDRLAEGTERLPRPRWVDEEHATVGGVPGLWVRPKKSTSTTAVLYLHGGAYTAGGPHTHHFAMSDLVRRTGVPFFLADYRLAPEHPHPAAVDDASAALCALTERFGHERVAIAGDSAGGGLAAAVLTRHAADGQPMPAAAALLAPWVDLTLKWSVASENRNHDVMLTATELRLAAEAYGRISGVDHPEVSPAAAELSGLPPTLIQVGTWDLLFDEAVELARQMTASGVAVELDTWQGMQHVFQVYWALIPEARRANGILAAFLRHHLGDPTD